MIKCEWCGNIYDISVHKDCPKCGGANANINNSKILSKDKKRNLFLISLGIFLFFIVFMIYRHFSLYGYFDKTYYTCYSLKDAKDIKVGNGSFYFDSFYVRKGFSASEHIFSGFDLFVDSIDLSEHIIDLYLYQGDKKYRLNIDVNKKDVNSINETLMTKGHLNFYATFDIKEDDILLNFDKIEIEVDKESYIFNLVNDECIFYDKYLYGKGGQSTYFVSDEIRYENGNVFYIEGLDIYTSQGKSSLNLHISNSLKDFNSSNLKIYLKDIYGLKYRAYEPFNFYSPEITEINDLLKKEFEYISIWLELGGMDKKFESLIFDVDGKIYEVPIFSSEN